MIDYHDLTNGSYAKGVINHWLCCGVITYISSVNSEASDCELMVGYYG